MYDRLRVAVVLVAVGCGSPTSHLTQDDAAVDAEHDASFDAPLDASPLDAPTLDTASLDASIDAPPLDAPTIDAPSLDAPIDAPSLDAPIDAPIVATDATSGSRLKLAWLQTPDGFRAVTSTSQRYYDALLAVDCAGVVWTDGNLRCTPATRQAVYSDSLCSTPRATPLDASVTPYVSDHDASGRYAHVYTQGPAVPAPEYWQRINGVCTGPSPNPWGTPGNPTLSSLVEVANLAELTIISTGPGPLQQRWIASADGLRDPLLYSAFDASLVAPCDISETTGRCTPRGIGTASLFSDSACTQDAYEQPSGELPAFFDHSTACAPDDAVYAVGPAITASALYKRGTGSCSINPSTGPVQRFAVGPQVGVIKHVALTRGSAPGHRLQPVLVTGAGLSAPSSWFHDTALDLECHLSRSGCLPVTAPQTIVLYTNPACTTAASMISVRPPDACGVPSPVPGFARTSLGIHRVGASHPIGGLWRRVGAQCDPASYETPFGYTYYDIDPTPIPASAFETATYSVDP